MPVRIEKLSGKAFLAFPEMKNLLVSEIKTRFKISLNAKEYGDLLYFSEWPYMDSDADNSNSGVGENFCDNCDKGNVPYWCSTAMEEPFLLHFDSIGEAARALKEIQRSWAPYQFQLFRRSSLIQEKLPYINLKTRKFPVEIPKNPVGLYTLIDENTIIASAKTTSFIPAGRIQFEEDHENPPSRAYLKIQEGLTMAHHLFGVDFPEAGQRCFDAGACPGGWTWVLVQLGCNVFAVDRAELAENLMNNPLVEFKTHDAFTLKPEELGKFDWVFSDVICYPERLLGWVKAWLASGMIKNMICTIKMQGEINWDIVKEFASIPDSRVLHLNYNKHELTWIHVEE
ncbi:MAG: SAM-dependent methyltransferase [Treponema sp.]|nr:SAM-dependent methyltransferase [Treponema sp.]